MKVGEMIERLRRYDPEAEVRIAVQPNYPHQHAVGGLVGDDEMSAVCAEENDDRDGGGEAGVTPRDGERLVYITEGDWLGYGPSDAWWAVAVNRRRRQ